MNDFDLAGQTAIVTGAGRGLGRAHALLLAARGARVVINDLGSDAHGTSSADSTVADAVVEEIEAAGGEAVASGADISTEAGGKAVVDLALATFGRVDGLVHNAGILFDAPFTEPFEHIRRVLDVHLAGAWHVGQPAWRAMIDQGYGRIVFTSSASIYGMPRQSAYAAAKAGLIGLMRSLQADARAAEVDIKVNTVLPMGKTRMSTAQADRWNGLSGPEAVSPVVAYLLSRGCRLEGEAIVAGATHVARLTLTQTRGWAKREQGLTVEDVAAHLEDIFDPTGAFVPASTLEYLESTYALVMDGESASSGGS